MWLQAERPWKGGLTARALVQDQEAPGRHGGLLGRRWLEGLGGLLWSEEASEAVGRSRHQLSQAFSSQRPVPQGGEASGRPCLTVLGLTAPGGQAGCGVGCIEGQHATEPGGLNSLRVLSSLGQSRLRPRPSLRLAGAKGGQRSGHCPPSGCISVLARGGRRTRVARDAGTPGLRRLGGVPLLGVPSHNSEPIEGGQGHWLAWVLSCFAEAVLEPELPSPHPGAGAAREEEAGGAEGRGRGWAGLGPGGPWCFIRAPLPWAGAECSRNKHLPPGAERLTEGTLASVGAAGWGCRRGPGHGGPWDRGEGRGT